MRLDMVEILRGALVCPVCETRFAIADGAVVLDETAHADGATVCLAKGETASAEEAIRIAAFLGLTEPGGFIALVGSAARYASGVAELSQVDIVLLDPPGRVDAAPGTPLYGPASALARGSARGAVVPSDGARQLEGIVTALHSGGRLLAAAALPVPVGVRELARDREWWVAEREEREVTVQLRGVRPPQTRT